MIRKWLSKRLPNHKTLEHDSALKGLRQYLHHTKVWRLNHTAISRAVFIGLLIAFLPLPMQMLLAAILAIFLRANLPVAVILTWITNPFTFVPINYFILYVGKKMSGESNIENMPTPVTWHVDPLSLSWSTITTQLSVFSKAYLIGLPLVAFGVATLGYCVVRIMWYATVLSTKHWRRYKRRRR